MTTRYGRHYWLDRFPRARQPVYPKHRGDLAFDVVVIGGGLVGCATAHAFASAGIRTAIVEADRIGQAGTSAGPGLLRLDPDVEFRAFQEAHGLRAARHAWQSFRRAGLDFSATLRRLRVRCELAPHDALRVALDPIDEKRLRRELQARREAGIDATWLTSARLRLETGLEGHGAMRSPGDGHVDPYRAALGLAAAAVAKRAQVFERSPVTRVRAGRTGVEITTEGGSLRAGTVVVASSYPLPAFRPLQRHFRLVDSYCVLTPPLPSFVRRELGRSRAIVMDMEHPSHVLRRTIDDRLLFMGADQPHVPQRSRDKAVVQRTGQLMYELSKLYPAVSGIQPEYGWDLPVAEGSDGFICAGPHRNYPRHLFALGAGHNGAAAAFLAARVLLRHYQGQPERGDEVFGFPRLLG
jgi:glycine/D-amino acid oxidase-like deaminating enzyme